MNAVDKYEYKLKTEQMLELMENGAYDKAAEIADEIDWKRVRNVTMLMNVSDIYEKNEEYQKSYDVLRLAYHRAEGSRKVIYHLCTLAIKTGNVDEAIDYYDDFMQIAPKDPNQHILRYQILRAQRAPIEQQIEALEEFKKAEYIEEWAYELAKLYQEAGMTAECLEECDDLILWFSEGKYVYKAMELKMQYKPLTPSQQEKYDHRNEKVSAETEEMPDLAAYAAQKAEEDEEETPEEVQNADDSAAVKLDNSEEDEPDKPVAEDKKTSKMIGDTMRLDEALKKLLHTSDDGTDDTKDVQEDIPEEEPDITDLEVAIDEIESVADLEIVNQMAEKRKESSISERNLKTSGDITELIPDDTDEETPDEPELEEGELDLSEAEEFLADESAEEEESIEPEEDDGQVKGQMSLSDIIADWETQADESFASEEEIISDEEAEELEESESEEVEEELSVEAAEEVEETEEPEMAEEELPVEEAEEAEDTEESETEEIEEELPVEEAEGLEESESEEVEEELSVEAAEEAEDTEEPETEEVEEELPVEEAEEAEGLEESESEEVEEELSVEAAEEMEETEEPEAETAEEELLAEEAEEVEMPNVSEQEKPEDLTADTEENNREMPESERDSDIEATDADDDNMTEGEMAGETMEEKKKTEPILPPDIQRLIDEIEGVIPPEPEEQEERSARARRRVEGPRRNMGKLADQLRIDDEPDEDESEEYWDDDANEDYDIEPDEDIAEDYKDDDSDEDIIEDYDEEEYEEDEDEDYFYEEDEEEVEEIPENEEEILDSDGEELYDEDEYDPEDEDLFDDENHDLDDEELFDDEIPDFEEEFRVNPDQGDEPDDREIPDDDDGMDILSATTPLSRKETAKLIATGKTSPLPLDEISDALSMTDTGFIVHARYDLETQSGIGTRAGLTEEQKKLFSYFVPVRGMSEQLVDVLEQDKNCTNRGGTSRTGNLLIIGNKGNGKTVLAVDVVKAIQKQRDIRQGKVAIVTGESLNKKKIGDIFNKLYGGALIIEKAGKMNEKTVARLNKAMEKDTGELLIVLEEQRKPLDRLLSSNREFRRKFTSRLEVPIFINDELVTFGQTYAQENGYRIDEMGILALYSRIDSLQREDHAVTVAEVKEVMDEAIQHSQKASAKKLVKRVFGKNTDDSDRILLSEKDFNI